MIITVKKNEIDMDGESVQLKDLNSELLERVVDHLLNDECKINFENHDSPLSEFFENLKKETCETSSLREHVLNFKAERNQLKNELQGLDLSYSNEILEISDWKEMM